MRPIELCKTQVERDQGRLSNRIQRSIQEQIRSNKSTRQRRTMHHLNIIITAMSQEIVHAHAHADVVVNDSDQDQAREQLP
jgi:hypothetical protein